MERLHCLGRSISFLLLLASLLLFGIRSEVAAAGETYTLTPSPDRTVQNNTPGVALIVVVTNAIVGENYIFIWTVTSPGGTSRTATNSAIPAQSTFNVSVVYPRDFGPQAEIAYVGNYTVNVDQTKPVPVTSVATGRFEAGLTDSTMYQRTFSVSIRAQGYPASDNVTISIVHGSDPAPGFPRWKRANTNGVFSFLWQIPPDAPIGLYTLTLTGSVVKTPADTQSFTVLPASITISQITISQITIARNLLQKSETAEFLLTPTYTSGVPVTSGSVTLRIYEQDGTLHYSPSTYNSTLLAFQAAFRIPLNSQPGVWVATIEQDSLDDGYGNIGPAFSVVRGFTVQPAVLTTTVYVQDRVYGMGDVVAIYTTITTPDGSLFNAGTVTARLYFSGTQVGDTIGLTYVPGQTQWVGSYVVGPTDPAGVWLIEVEALDTYGNRGLGSTSTVVNVATPGPQPFYLFYFALVSLLVGFGLAATMLVRRFNVTSAPFEELFRLTGGELQPPTSLMIIGDPGSGTSTLALQLIRHQLSAGRYCGLLTYDSFPSEIQTKAESFGWDLHKHIEGGTLKILDCYSALVGTDKASIRDPVDFTEISIEVSSVIDQAAQGPVTILLDSITPIFNSAPANTAINFLRVLGAKVKNSEGIFILTATKGSFPGEVGANMEALVDGVIELSLTRKRHALRRTLTVKKIGGRKTSPTPTRFEIVLGKGILFKKQKLQLKILAPE